MMYFNTEENSPSIHITDFLKPPEIVGSSLSNMHSYLTTNTYFYVHRF